MYGPASTDFANAKMADHRRYATQVALENAARRSLRAERPAKRSWHADFLSFATVRRLFDLRKSAPVHDPVVATRLNGAAS